MKSNQDFKGSPRNKPCEATASIVSKSKGPKVCTSYKKV